jgi:trehalose 6-phosphate phosphatase
MNYSIPRYLFDCLDEVRRQLANCDRVAVFLDLDGTLAAITRTPKMTRIKPETKETLRALSREPGYLVSIVSGREMQDLRNIVDLPNIVYAGNHGLEISGPGLEFVHDEAKGCMPVVAGICERLGTQLQSVNGVIVEFKRLTASIHYRLVAAPSIDRVRAAVAEEIAQLGDRLHAVQGKRVLELKPSVQWDKGRAVRWVAERLAYDVSAAIYIGDDKTDEDAFTALPHSVTIHVGTRYRATAARYFVKSPDGVLAFLQYLPAISKVPHRSAPPLSPVLRGAANPKVGRASAPSKTSLDGGRVS